MMMMTLFNIYYKGGQIVGQPDDTYEATTDDFDAWLEKHNKDREADGQSIEGEDEFRVDEIWVNLFEKRKAKIYFSEEDLQDMQSSFHKEEGLWNTWTYTDENGDLIDVELHLGQED